MVWGPLGDPLNGGKMLAFLPLPDDSLGTQGPPGGPPIWLGHPHGAPCMGGGKPLGGSRVRWGVLPRVTHWGTQGPMGGGICLCLGALGAP